MHPGKDIAENAAEMQCEERLKWVEDDRADLEELSPLVTGFLFAVGGTNAKDLLSWSVGLYSISSTRGDTWY